MKAPLMPPPWLCPFAGRLQPQPTAAPASTPQTLLPAPDPSSPTSLSWPPAAPWPPPAAAWTRKGGAVTFPSAGTRVGLVESLADACTPACRPLSGSPLVRVKEEPPSPPRSPRAEAAGPGHPSSIVETPLSPTALIDSILRESEPAPTASATLLPDTGGHPPSPLPTSAPEKCLSVACLDK